MFLITSVTCTKKKPFWKVSIPMALCSWYSHTLRELLPGNHWANKQKSTLLSETHLWKLVAIIPTFTQIRIERTTAEQKDSSRTSSGVKQKSNSKAKKNHNLQAMLRDNTLQRIPSSSLSVQRRNNFLYAFLRKAMRNLLSAINTVSQWFGCILRWVMRQTH